MPQPGSDRPYSSPEELVADLHRDAADPADSANTSGLSSLGPDLFNLREPEPAPDFLRGHDYGEDYSNLTAAQRIAVLENLDLRKTRPTWDAMRPDALHTDVPVMSRSLSERERMGWAPAGVELPLPAHLETPKVVHSVWFFGAPLSGAFRQNLQISASQAPTFLFVNLPRVRVEEAIGRQPTDPADPLTAVWDFVRWTQESGVIPVSLAEVSNADTPFDLADATATEMLKLNGPGWAAASDNVRMSILKRWGGAYLDSDNHVTDVDRLFSAVNAREAFAVNMGVAGGDPNNDAWVMPKGHPAAELWIALQARNYGATQVELFPEVLLGADYRMPGGNAMRNSVLYRTGPGLFNDFVQVLEYRDKHDLPPISGIERGAALSWGPESATRPQPSSGRQDTLFVAKAVVETLARDLLSNRNGDLHLTAVRQAIDAHPQRDLLLNAVVSFIASRPDLAGAVQSVTLEAFYQHGDVRVDLPEAASKLIEIDGDPFMLLGEGVYPAHLNEPVGGATTTPSPIDPATSETPHLAQEESADGGRSETVGDTRSESTTHVPGDAATDDTESAFDETVRAELLERLHRLSGDTEPSGDPMPVTESAVDGRGAVWSGDDVVSQDDVAAGVTDGRRADGESVERGVPSRTADEFEVRWAGYLARGDTFDGQIVGLAGVAAEQKVGGRPEGVPGRGPLVDEQVHLWESVQYAVRQEVARRVDASGVVTALRDDFRALLDPRLDSGEMAERIDAAMSTWAERIGEAADRVEQWEASAGAASVATVHEFAAPMVALLPQTRPDNMPEELHQFFHDGLRSMVTDLLAGGGEAREVARGRDLDDLINELRDDFVAMLDFDEVPARGDAALEQWAERIGAAADRVEQWQASADPASVAVVNELADAMVGPLPPVIPGTVAEETQQFFHDGIRAVLADQLAGGATRRDAWEQSAEVRALAEQLRTHTRYGEVGVPDDEGYLVPWSVMLQRIGDTDGINLIHSFQQDWNAMLPNRDYATFNELEDDRRIYARDTTRGILESLPLSELLDGPARGVGELAPEVEGLYQRVAVAVTNRLIYGNDNPNVGFQEAQRVARELLTGAEQMAGLADVVDLLRQQTQVDAPPPYVDAPPPYTEGPADDGGRSDLVDRPSSADQPIRSYEPYENLAASVVGELPTESDPRVNELLQTVGIAFAQRPASAEFSAAVAEAWADYEIVALVDAGMDPEVVDGVIAEFRNTVDSAWDNALAAADAIRDAGVPLPDVPLRETADQASDVGPDGAGDRGEPVDQQSPKDLLRDLAQSADRLAEFPHAEAEQLRLRMLRWVQPPQGGLAKFELAQALPVYETVLSALAFQAAQKNGTLAAQRLAESLDLGLLVSIGRELANRPQTEDAAIRSLRELFLNAKADIPDTSDVTDNTPDGFSGFRPEPASEGLSSVESGGRDAGTFGSGSRGGGDGVGSWVGDGDSVSGDGARSLDGDGWDAGTFGSRSPEPEDGFGSGLGNSDSPSGDGAQSSPGERTESPGRTSRSGSPGSEDGVGSWVGDGDSVSGDGARSLDGDGWDAGTFGSRSPVESEYGVDSWLTSVDSVSGDGARSLDGDGWDAGRTSRSVRGLRMGSVRGWAMAILSAAMVPGRWMAMVGMRGRSGAAVRSPRTGSVRGWAIATLPAVMVPSRALASALKARVAPVGLRSEYPSPMWAVGRTPIRCGSPTGLR